MGTYVQVVPVKFKTDSVVVGTPVVLDTQSFPFPLTVVAKPGASGTLLVEYSCTPNAAGNAGAATWFSWPAGAAGVNTNDVLISPVAALRFTAATSNGSYEVNA